MRFVYAKTWGPRIFSHHTRRSSMLSACVCSTSCRRKQFGALREARAEAERIARRVQFSGVLAQHDVDVLSAICSLPTVTFKQDATRLPPGVTTDSGGDTDPFPASALEMQSTRPCHAPAAGMSAPSASEVSKRVTSFESYRASTRKRTATHMRSSPRTYQGFSFMAFSTARVGSIAYRVADQIWNVP